MMAASLAELGRGAGKMLPRRRCPRTGGCAIVSGSNRRDPMPSPDVAYRICPLCVACCGLEIELRDGRVANIRGDEEDVFSAGYLCPKGVALKDLHEDPDRLRAPLVKRG